MTTLCGRDFTEIDGLTSQMVLNLDTLQSNAADTLSLLRCENLVPLYTDTVYNGTCTYSVKGITWTFSAFLVIACMGMFMIMFRSSYLGNDEEDVDDLFKESAALGEPIGDYAYEEELPYEDAANGIYSSKYSNTTDTRDYDDDGEQASAPSDAEPNPTADTSYTETYDQDYENSVNRSIASAPNAQTY